MSNSGRPMSLLKVLLVAMIGGVIGAGVTFLGLKETGPKSAERPAIAMDMQVPSSEEATEFSEAIRKAEPSVVSIESIYPPDLRQRRRRFAQTTGHGSGIIIDGEKGHVVTNAHVVRNAEKIKVQLGDDREFDAKLIGEDRIFDIALLKINGEDLPSATLGSSEDLPVGAWVVAIGNPLAFERSVTAGIVSGKGRYVLSPRGDIDLPDLLQTDAAINPGNSGGALVNLQGEVVGIPTVVVRTALAEGLGFAVPIDRAKLVVQDILKYGKVRHPWLGVLYSNIPQSLNNREAPKDRKGVLLLDVADKSPADRAGLSAGDIIIKANGKEIERREDLHMLSRSLEVGDEMTLQVWRDGRERQVTLVIGEMPEMAEIKRLFSSTSR